MFRFRSDAPQVHLFAQETTPNTPFIIVQIIYFFKNVFDSKSYL